MKQILPWMWQGTISHNNIAQRNLILWYQSFCHIHTDRTGQTPRRSLSTKSIRHEANWADELTECGKHLRGWVWKKKQKNKTVPSEDIKLVKLKSYCSLTKELLGDPKLHSSWEYFSEQLDIYERVGSQRALMVVVLVERVWCRWSETYRHKEKG